MCCFLGALLVHYNLQMRPSGVALWPRSKKHLLDLQKRIAEGKLRDRFKMERNLGRIQASHPQVADLYEMAVKDSKEGPRLIWRQKPEQHQWLEAREGAYLLRTNLTVDGAARSLEEVHATVAGRSY
jgi:hypothetical protein